MTKGRAPLASDPASGPGPELDLDLDALRITRPEEEPTAARPTRPSPRWPVLVLVLVLAAVLVPALLRGRRTSEPEGTTTAQGRTEPADAVRPPPPPRASGFSAAGWVKLPLYHPVHVTALVEGRVEEILVFEGHRVAKGSVVARLYARDYEALLEVAEATVAAAGASYEKSKAGFRKQEVAEARAEVDGLEAELETAEEILTHSRELQPGGAIPLEELQVDETKVRMLRARLAMAGERLALYEEGYRKEDIALAHATLVKAEAERDLARLRVEYTQIRAPMDGVVLERKASRGQWLEPKSGVIVDLYDPADLEARVDVNQDDVSKVFLGQKVDVSTRAEPGRVHVGRVVLIEPKADLVKNTVPVRVKLSSTEGESQLYPDMVVTARFLIPETENAKERVAPPR